MRLFSSLLALLFSSAALAGPGFIPIQGVLTDSAGVAIDGAVDVTFTLYDDANASTSLWRDTITVDVVDGRFATELGGGNLSLELNTFAVHTGAHLEIQVAGDSAMPLVPLDHVPYAAWADNAGDAATLNGGTLADIRAEIPAGTDLNQAARDVAYDTELELTTVLDDNYTYTPGTGIDIASNVVSVDQTQIETWAAAVCYDSETELTDLLDDNYLAATYTPAWSAITNIPAGFADGTDDGFTTKGELTALLDGDYLAASYTPDWSDIDNVPAGLLDGTDDGFTTEGELTDLLDDNYVASSNGTAAGLRTTGTLSTGLVRLESNSDVVDDSFTGALVVGTSGAVNLGIDGNEIMARSTTNGPSTLNLQLNGGNTAVGGDLNVTGAVNMGSTELECAWTACMDTPVPGGAVCGVQMPGYPILGGVDVAVQDSQLPSACTSINHEDEMRLYCCRFAQP
ncbi:MAG: hypothetical protein KC912_10030 [Proteobacteria bacterium]|nr:hypothetical protein [Pseudomonadota bacterium]